MISLLINPVIYSLEKVCRRKTYKAAVGANEIILVVGVESCLVLYEL